MSNQLRNSTRKKKKKKVKLIGNETPAQIMTRFCSRYEKLCYSEDVTVCLPFRDKLRQAIEKNSLLKQMMLIGRNKLDVKESRKHFNNSVSSAFKAMRTERYIYLHQIIIINIHLNNEYIILMSEVLERGIYPIQHFEIMDCVFNHVFLERLARSLNCCKTLKSLILDYNEFGDEGCMKLCEGLRENKSLNLLSLNFCSLEQSSGACIGELINTSSIRQLYLDGNDLSCTGLMCLLGGCVRQAVLESEERRMLAERLEEENVGQESAEEPVLRLDSTRTDMLSTGPRLESLHISDNGIDSHDQQGEHRLIEAMHCLSGLIRYSVHMKELDLGDNLIGESGAREILDALQHRKTYNLPKLRLKTTHRMRTETLTEIIRLTDGLTKKKKKKRGKKKKKRS